MEILVVISAKSGKVDQVVSSNRDFSYLVGLGFVSARLQLEKLGWKPVKAKFEEGTLSLLSFPHGRQGLLYIKVT